jgi:hypothetical protein
MKLIRIAKPGERQMKFEVSAQWMQACGLSSYNPVMEVIRIDDYSLQGAADWCAQMIIVKHPYLTNSTWTVAIGRGKLINGE